MLLTLGVIFLILVGGLQLLGLVVITSWIASLVILLGILILGPAVVMGVLMGAYDLFREQLQRFKRKR